MTESHHSFLKPTGERPDGMARRRVDPAEGMAAPSQLRDSGDRPPEQGPAQPHTSDSWQTPGLGLLCKLGSIARHCEEALSTQGHVFDFRAIEAIMRDDEVQAWLAEMDARALLPVRR
jgi:hypothetical protein